MLYMEVLAEKGLPIDSMHNELRHWIHVPHYADT
jgi:hypothetical protein